jgi:hypothetical protein
VGPRRRDPGARARPRPGGAARRQLARARPRARSADRKGCRLKITIALPLRLESASNLHEGHWAQRHKRVARERDLTKTITRARLPDRWAEWTASIAVTLRRIAPRRLDEGDNLAGAFKAVRDGVADALGLGDDEASGVSWSYDQQRRKRREYGVEIVIELIPPGPPEPEGDPA